MKATELNGRRDREAQAQDLLRARQPWSQRRGPASNRQSSEAGIYLYWLPLGAGGWFVRMNGRIYEAINGLVEGRRPLALYHSALEVREPEGRFVVENAWPVPDSDAASRGVVVQGPVGSRWIGRFRVFRYEVRRWRDGTIPDVNWAVESPRRVSDDARAAHRLLDLVGSLPKLVWGRDELGTGEMWNSNSVISWLLSRSGLRRFRSSRSRSRTDHSTFWRLVRGSRGWPHPRSGGR